MLFSVTAQLLVEIFGHGAPYILEPCLFGLLVGVHQRSKSNVPSVVGELFLLRRCQSGKRLDCIDAAIAERDIDNGRRG